MICLPHIFNGTSSSRSMGCDINISLDFRHRIRISPSDKCTLLSSLASRTVGNYIKNHSPSYTELTSRPGRETPKGKTPNSAAISIATDYTRWLLPSNSLDMMSSMFNLSSIFLKSVCNLVFREILLCVVVDGLCLWSIVIKNRFFSRCRDN